MSFNWLVFGDLYWMLKSFYKILCLKTQLMAPFLNINAVALIFCDPVQWRSYIFKCDLSGLVLFEAIVLKCITLTSCFFLWSNIKKGPSKEFWWWPSVPQFFSQGAPVRQINNHFLTTDTLSALTFSEAPSVKRLVLVFVDERELNQPKTVEQMYPT